MAEALSFDFDALTPRMLVDFKNKAAVDLLALLDDEGGFDLTGLAPEALAGFVWLAMRMSGRPDATWDDALDTPFSQLDFSTPDGEPDPTSASSDD